MSIYLSIVTLDDPDIVSTIITAMDRCDDLNNVHIGLAAAVSDNFYQKYIRQFENNSHITIKKFEKDLARGVGRGRILSRFAYNNEDYILQIDSHTIFNKSWDTSLIRIYEEAKNKTKNEKTILTAYLGPHQIENNEVRVYDYMTRYCTYNAQQFGPTIRLQSWFDRPIRTFPKEVNAPKEKFIPAIKIGAHFMFGDRNFADYSGISANLVFFEEEIIQTINLLEAGYSLVFPNMELPLTHRYTNEQGVERESGKDLFENEESPACLMTRNMYDLIENRPEACMRYKKYSKYDLETGRVRPFHIPESFDYFGIT